MSLQARGTDFCSPHNLSIFKDEHPRLAQLPAPELSPQHPVDSPCTRREPASADRTLSTRALFEPFPSAPAEPLTLRHLHRSKSKDLPRCRSRRFHSDAREACHCLPRPECLPFARCFPRGEARLPLAKLLASSRSDATTGFTFGPPSPRARCLTDMVTFSCALPAYETPTLPDDFCSLSRPVVTATRF